ncbi:alpha/beta hydrolase [Micromonospora sp. STR1s_5]|nr:alpha/beta hydrolase [Micromonospora sp. STR1s_5]
MRRADAGTLVDAATSATLTWFELGFATFVNFFDATWADLANMLLALERGQPAALTSPMVPVDGDKDLTEYALPAFCQDWSLPVDGFAEWNRYLELSRAAAPHLRASPLAVRFGAICLGWTATNPQHQLRVRTSAPLLVLNGRYDPATPYDGAQRVVRQLGSRDHLVTYEGRATPATHGPSAPVVRWSGTSSPEPRRRSARTVRPPRSDGRGRHCDAPALGR